MDSYENLCYPNLKNLSKSALGRDKEVRNVKRIHTKAPSQLVEQCDVVNKTLKDNQ